MIILAANVPSGVEIDYNDSNPCAVMGIDLCEKPAPVMPIPVDASCVTHGMYSIPFVDSANHMERLFPDKIPFIPIKKKDKPPRV